MSQSELGFLAVVPLGVVIDFEAEATVPKADDLDALQDALERAGVEFIEDGVKLKTGQEVRASRRNAPST